MVLYLRKEPRNLVQFVKTLQCGRQSQRMVSSVHFADWNKTGPLKFPEKLRGTIVERWAEYWTRLFKDYQEACIGIAEEIRTKPWRIAGLAGVFTCGWLIAQMNPDETDFRNVVLEYSNKVGLVGRAIRNPAAVDHLSRIEFGYNTNTLRRLNLGFVSFMWLDNYDSQMGLYKAQCKYIEPVYLNWSDRIVDVGFLHKWWILEEKMKDFDVNPKEWFGLESE